LKASQWLAPLGRWRDRRARQTFEDAIAPGIWCLDRAEAKGEHLEFSGWVLSLRKADFTFTVNGRKVTSVSTGEKRQDVAVAYPFVSNAEASGFTAQSPLEARESRGVVPIEIQCTGTDLRPLREQQAFHVPPLAGERWPMPEPERIRRVHGGTDEASFRIVGYTNFRKLDWVLDRVTGRGIEGYRRILDWGCGCGRLLRHMSGLSTALITGVDVDEDNLSWCAKNLPFAATQSVPLHPPTPLPAASFELIIGISIFTHLSEDVQLEWLEELRRLAAPGGILLMSVHGPVATAQRNDLLLWQHVEKHGFADGHSHDLDDVLAESDYYRNTYHSHSYIRSTWGRFFDVVEIVPACIGNVQDLVVLRLL
jgi:SAM-dependent methyltransferase